ncbi:hypothetical protein IQ251_18125 [Saccharopolyspora sp. HNM0983]|uniref:Uncharacterized protein n=1 Tax=Saccharopolyspora montiporae TaxID=2781240 RepID=A0A929G201_9PSEU|nr:hypothetical protein [Saccharopolyspora sp. HNM0983]MBE9376372.1 hypothetical protein [Saccharopolyspora sp. HNM0983]
MDPRHRADEALARARARGAFVVTPDNATSPMDAASTVRIPREMIAGSEETTPPTDTFPVPGGAQHGPEPVLGGWPTEDYGFEGNYGFDGSGPLGSRLNPGE